MTTMDIGKMVHDAYNAIEDRYYQFLDRLNAYVPVYSIVDPIDRIVPSMVLFATLFLVVLGFGGFYACQYGVICAKEPVPQGTPSCVQLGGRVCDTREICFGTLAEGADTEACCVGGECKELSPTPPGDFKPPQPAPRPVPVPVPKPPEPAPIEPPAPPAFTPYALEFRFVSNGQPVNQAVHLQLACANQSDAFFSHLAVGGSWTVPAIPCKDFGAVAESTGYQTARRYYAGKQAGPQIITLTPVPELQIPRFEVLVRVRIHDTDGTTHDAAGGQWLITPRRIDQDDARLQAAAFGLSTARFAASDFPMNLPTVNNKITTSDPPAFFSDLSTPSTPKNQTIRFASESCDAYHGNLAQLVTADGSARFLLEAGTYEFTATSITNGIGATERANIQNDSVVDVLVQNVAPDGEIRLRVENETGEGLPHASITLYNATRLIAAPFPTPPSGEYKWPVRRSDGPFFAVVHHPAHLIRTLSNVDVQALNAQAFTRVTLIEKQSDENIARIRMRVTDDSTPPKPVSDHTDVYVCQGTFPFALNYNPLHVSEEGRLYLGENVGASANPPIYLGSGTYDTIFGPFVYSSQFRLRVEHPLYYGFADENRVSAANHWNVLARLVRAGGRFEFLSLDQNAKPVSPFGIDVRNAENIRLANASGFDQNIERGQTFVTPVIAINERVRARVDADAFIHQWTRYLLPVKNQTVQHAVYLSPYAADAPAIELEYQHLLLANEHAPTGQASLLQKDASYWMVLHLRLPHEPAANARYTDVQINARLPYRQGEPPVFITDTEPIDFAFAPYANGYPQYSDTIHATDVYQTVSPRPEAIDPRASQSQGARLLNTSTRELDRGEYPVLVKLFIPPTTPAGYEFDVVFEARAKRSGEVIATTIQTKRFKLGAPTCDRRCERSPALDWFIESANENESFAPIPLHALIDLRAETVKRLRVSIHNRTNTNYTSVRVDANATNLRFGPDDQKTAITLLENAGLQAFTPLTLGETTVKTPLSDGNPWIDLRFTSNPRVADDSNRLRIRFRATGGRPLGVGYLADPVGKRLTIWTTDTANELANALVQIRLNKNPVTNPNAVPDQTGVTGANGQITFENVRLSGNDKLFVTAQKSGFETTTIVIDAATFNDIGLIDPTNPAQCVTAVLLEETLSSGFSLPLPGVRRSAPSPANTQTVHVTTDGCDREFDVQISAHPVLASYANPVSIRPAHIRMKPFERATFEIQVNPSAPLGILPFVLSAHASGMERENVRILDLYSYEIADDRPFDIGGPAP